MEVRSEVPAEYRTAELARRIALIPSSFARLLSRPLIPSSDDPISALWHAPAAIVAHGTEEDPIFFFANRGALSIFESDVAKFTRMPSRLSAEAPLRDERRALLERVAARGFITDYAGVRITATGKRFRIEGAIVWNLLDEEGEMHGQAATFTL